MPRRLLVVGNTLLGDAQVREVLSDRAEHARGVELMKSVLTELHAAERSSHANLHFADLVRRADPASD